MKHKDGQTQYLHDALIILTLNLLTTTIVAPPSNASKWQVGFNSIYSKSNSSPHF
jgi:hypothetical protein